MEPNSVEFHTEAPTRRDSMISPEFEYDVSIVGIFLGMGLGLALIVNNIRRGTAVMTATKSTFAILLAATRRLKETPTPPSSAIAASPDEDAPRTTTSHTSAQAVTFVFTERA